MSLWWGQRLSLQPPPATTPAFCSPGLLQGAGVSRSARPSRCRSNHALITALGKFAV